MAGSLELVVSDDRRFWEEWVIGVALIGMAGLNLLAILSRMWLHLSLPWIEEVEVGLFVWTIFLSGGVGVAKGIHLGFGWLVEKSPLPLRSAFDGLSLALFGGWFALLGFYGVHMVINQVAHDQRSATLGWPEWMFAAAVPVGAVLGIWRVISASRARRL